MLPMQPSIIFQYDLYGATRGVCTKGPRAFRMQVEENTLWIKAIRTGMV